MTGDGGHCEPLTLCDAHSRYLLRCQAMARLDTEHVWPVLDAAFREFGLPHRLRSDNGAPFASRGAGGLSRLSVKVIKAGVVPERIAPGKPQRNGRLERLQVSTRVAGHREPAGREPARAAGAPAQLPSISTTKNVRTRRSATTPGRALRCLAAALRRRVAPTELQCRPRSQVRAPQRRDPMARRNHLHQPSLGRRPANSIEDDDGDWIVSYSQITLGVLARDGDRLRKPRRRACWTCGQREDALPTGSTGRANERQQADLNETRNLLPMSPV